MYDISIVIVNHNTVFDLKNCLNSIYKFAEKLKLEIIVVDNASTDNSFQFVKKKFPQVQIISNKKNLLYSRANNQGLKIISGKYFLILNSDTKIHQNTLQKMYQFMESHPKCGLSSCRQTDLKNHLIITCHKFHSPLPQILELPPFYRFFKNSQILDDFRYRNWDRKNIRQVDSIPGSFMFGRKEILNQIGLLDDNLKLFYSDADFCQRVKTAGFEIYHNGKATFTHLSARTLNNFPANQINKQSYNDMTYYFRKHYGLFWSTMIFLLTRLSLICNKSYALILRVSPDVRRDESRSVIG